jgi:hypothetical protein
VDHVQGLTAAAREAVLERRADRARELMHAAEVVLLGGDDQETIRLDWRPERFRLLPGVRRTPEPPRENR